MGKQLDEEMGRTFRNCLRVGINKVSAGLTRSNDTSRDWSIGLLRYLDCTYKEISESVGMSPAGCRERVKRIAEWGYIEIRKNQELGDALSDPKRCQQVKPEEQLKMIRICEVLKGDWGD